MSDAGLEALAAPESVSPTGGEGARGAASQARQGSAATDAEAALASAASERSELAQQSDALALEWTLHPAGQSPARAFLVGGMLVGASLLGGMLAQSFTLGALALLFLAVSLRAFFLPRHYALDELGAQESGPLAGTRRVEWRHVKQVRAVRFGVWLDERHSGSRLLPARGLFLRTRGNRGAVLAAAQHAVERGAQPG